MGLHIENLCFSINAQQTGKTGIHMSQLLSAVAAMKRAVYDIEPTCRRHPIVVEVALAESACAR